MNEFLSVSKHTKNICCVLFISCSTCIVGWHKKSTNCLSRNGATKRYKMYDLWIQLINLTCGTIGTNWDLPKKTKNSFIWRKFSFSYLKIRTSDESVKWVDPGTWIKRAMAKIRLNRVSELLFSNQYKLEIEGFLQSASFRQHKLMMYGVV